MLKPKEMCPKCGQIRYMTRHHIKDNFGKKTGEIQIMCRDCHDEIEEEYKLLGKVITAKKKTKNKFKKFLNLNHYQIYQMRNERDRTIFSLKMSIHNRKKKIKNHDSKCFIVLKYLEKIEKYERDLDYIKLPIMPSI